MTRRTSPCVQRVLASRRFAAASAHPCTSPSSLSAVFLLLLLLLHLRRCLSPALSHCPGASVRVAIAWMPGRMGAPAPAAVQLNPCVNFDSPVPPGRPISMKGATDRLDLKQAPPPGGN